MQMAGTMRMTGIRSIIILALALALTPALPAATASGATDITVSHGLTLLEKLKYPADFKNLDYVNPDAPKGGRVKLHAIGSFDTFNRFTIKGDPAAGLGFVFETLMTSPDDEISAEYGLIAESIEVPDDLSYATFTLRANARFSDGKPITADDVIFSFNILREKGRPFYRFYYANISKVEKLGRLKVKFSFSGPPNRELPQITGQLPVLAKHYWEGRDFSKTTLERPVSSGPYRIGKFEPGRFIEYERMTDYWGRDLPIRKGTNNFDVIRFDFYRDQTVALEAFKANEYDFRQETTSKDWATAYDFPAVAAGLVVKREVPHSRPTGMAGFAYNLRRDKFRDPRLREALGYAFDFEWSNKNLFYGQYTRTASFYSNSELAATGAPSAGERALLEAYRGQIPDQVFGPPYAPPKTDGSGKIRSNLRKAVRLLRQAGWRIKDNRLIDPNSGNPLEIEFLLASPLFERILAPFIRNLKRLGVVGRIRTVDPAQYQNRIRDFDFDMIFAGFGQSESPGNEQRDYWSSSAADRPGSRNIIGIRSKAVDGLIEKIVEARNRASLVTATRALDRVLRWGHYVIPGWYIRSDRIAYWDKFGLPKKSPGYGVGFMSWWIDPAKEKSLAQRRSSARRVGGK
jgi:microcin C transport system substrate-binding protein